MRSAAAAMLIGLVLAAVGCASSGTGTVKQTPAHFLENVFQGMPPEEDCIWVTPVLRSRLESVLGSRLKAFRIPYWQEGGKTVWVLDAKARGKPVTAAIIVAEGQIVRLEVLHAEGRYGEKIRKESFTNQFRDLGLVEGDRLDKPIDAVSGATISANAILRMARLALVLDEIRLASDSSGQ